MFDRTVFSSEQTLDEINERFPPDLTVWDLTENIASRGQHWAPCAAAVLMASLKQG